MKTNVGTLDRLCRAVLGVALFWLAYGSGLAMMESAVLKYVVVGLGLVMLGVAAIGTCPLYTLIGIRTCRTRSGAQQR